MTTTTRDELQVRLLAMARTANEIRDKAELIRLYAVKAVTALCIGDDILAETMQPNIDGLNALIVEDTLDIIKTMRQVVELTQGVVKEANNGCQ